MTVRYRKQRAGRARSHRVVAAMLAAVLLLSSLSAAAVVLTGEVRSAGAQDLFTPPSMSSPVVLRTYVPDGTRVKKGDAILSIDAGQAASQLRSLHDQITQIQETTAKTVADLKVKLIDAKLARIDAKAARDTAAVDAAIPENLISALDYDTYQGTFKSAKRDAVLKTNELHAAQKAVARAQKDGALQTQKLQTQLAFAQSQVDTATVYAKRDGVVVHAFASNNPWSRKGRYEQGSTTYPGTQLGQIVGAGRYSVRAWALQPDRQGLKVGQPVSLHFDALPGKFADGHITAISGASAAKPEWGAGRYYSVDIALDATAAKLHLLPGMSVRVRSDGKAAATTQPASAKQADQPMKASGEIFAQQSVAIMPPQIPGLWQLNVTRMATDGALIKKGQPAVVFAAGSLAQKLPAKQSSLAEKKRAQEQLQLQMADDARTASLATAQAKANADKARRKAQQPEKYVPGIEYKKLVIDRQRTAQRLALAAARESAEAQSRKAQLQLAAGEVTALQREVAQMQASLMSLTVPAPRDGIFMHAVSPDGSKIDTGSQVWRGMSVGDIPDIDSLAVRANLPERDLLRVHVGQSVRVQLTGGASQTFNGHIAEVGHSVHSKSGAEPIPVIDLRIDLDDRGAKLRPGQPVSVEILAKKDAS